MDPKSKVLVVDDLLEWRERLSDILIRQGGYSVATAATYEEAVAALEAEHLDVVVVDLRLEERDKSNVQGLALLDVIDKTPKTATVVVTGHATVPIMSELYEKHKVTKVILKEFFRASEFIDAVKKAMYSVSLKRILVVEDEEEWQTKLRDILVRDGYRVDVEPTYGTALSMFQREDFDLVLIDLSLVPGEALDRQGLALAEDLAARGIPAVIVTGYGAIEDVRKAVFEYGVFDFLDKGEFDLAKFKRVVAEAIARKPKKKPKKDKEEEKKRGKSFRDETLDYCS
jgi:DNA-binding NtrC family response regulator